MKAQAYKTDKIKPNDNLFDILDKNLPALKENSILAVTSKIVSICENNVIPVDKVDKTDLIYQEADKYLKKDESKYGFVLTIKNNILIPTAGIDESNGQNNYILWPKDPYKSANEIRKYLKNKFGLKNFGVIITDSKTTPLRWGTTGVAIAYSGLKPLNDYIGKKDIFGKEMRVTKANIMDALAVTAVLVMGEGSEQTPLAIIEETPFVQFCDNNPSKKEIKSLTIDINDDLYGPILTSVDWHTSQPKK